MLIGLGGEKGRYEPNSMKTAIGDHLRSILNGEKYIIKKLVQNMAVLESQNGMKQIITEVDNLRLFYTAEEKIRVERRREDPSIP